MAWLVDPKSETVDLPDGTRATVRSMSAGLRLRTIAARNAFEPAVFFAIAAECIDGIGATAEELEARGNVENLLPCVAKAVELSSLAAGDVEDAAKN